MKKHTVTFYSPGIFVSETTTVDIDSWDVELAKKMARNIKERHGAVPYGFRFKTVKYHIENSRPITEQEVKSSNMYYLGGTVRHLDFIILEDKPDEKTLIWNMKNNGYDRVIENTNSYKITLPLNKEDVVLEWE